MKKNKIFISIIMSLFMILTTVGNITVYAEETSENIIYRNSIDILVSDVNYTANITGSDDGHIKIVLQYNDISSSEHYQTCTFNLVSYDYNMISELNYIQYPYYTVIYNYKNTNINYKIEHRTGINKYGQHTSDRSGTIDTFDLYVKENYLNTNQTLTILGQNIEIPFGKPVIDLYCEILELRNKNAELTNLVNDLRNTLNAVGSRMYGDMNDDGHTDASDASILLAYYAKISVGEVITFDEYIDSIKKEVN